METHFLMLAAVFGVFSYSEAFLPHTQCNRTYEKVGGFIENVADRVLSELLINDRCKASDKNDGHVLDWNAFEASIHSLACRCAAKAKEKGYEVFGLQYYGECWSAPTAEVNYAKYGKAEDSQSYQYTRNPPPACDKTKEQECVGGPLINYVYRLKDACVKALDIGIILDSSVSVGPLNFRTALNFIQAFIRHFQVSPQGTHFGFIIYSTYPTLQFKMSDSRYHNSSSIMDRIGSTRYTGGNTRTDRALEMAANQLFTPAGGDRNDKENILIVFTDGRTNPGSKPYPEVLRSLRAKHVRTIAVGVGPGINKAELQQIAMGDPKYVVQVNRFSDLKDKLQVILNDFFKG